MKFSYKLKPTYKGLYTPKQHFKKKSMGPFLQKPLAIGEIQEKLQYTE